MAEGEELDYDSDPDDALCPSRRREASDDEDGERSGGERRAIRSEDELEGEGGAPGYDEEEYEEEMIEEEEEEEIEEEEEEIRVLERVGDLERSGIVVEERNEGEEEGKKEKESEPFAVPTAGAFYMHDDRFDGNVRGRHRYCLI